MNFSDLGKHLRDSSGKLIPVKDALGNKAGVALYFSAHWCPPCRQFTPVLSDIYRKSYKQKGLEVVFVSSDHDEQAFNEYHGSMPWLAVPYGERGIKDRLSQMFGISGIPALIVLDSTGKVITNQGREMVMQDSNGSNMFGLKPVNQAFLGPSNTTGGSSGSTAPSGTTIQPPNVWIDRSLPVTKLKLRFPDGQSMTQEFNESTSVADVIGFVSKCLNGKRVALVGGFPPKPLDDLSRSLKDAELFNAALTVKLI